MLLPALPVLWWMLAGRQGEIALPAAGASPPAPVASADVPVTPAREPRREALAEAPARFERSAAPAEGNSVEVCGYGAVQLAVDDPNPLQRVPLVLRHAALDQVEARLAAHPEAAVRAAGLLIGARGRVAGSRARIQQLARLAVSTQDAAVYLLALRGCRTYGETDAGACALLSRAQWARLDPDNLHPWLELAAEAAARDDAPAEAEAMRQAAQARHSDARAGLLPALVAQALGPPVPGLQRALAASLARSLDDGWTLTSSLHADAYCAAEALADGSRAAVCDAVARTLAEHSQSLADVASGAAIGRQLGWPTERWQGWLHEQQALLQLGEAGSAAAANDLDFSCARLAQRQAWSRAVGAQGELASLRQRIAQLAPRAAPPADHSN